MARLWFVFGLLYLIFAALIFLHHSLVLNATWRWDEVLHHEAFTMSAIWASVAFLVVAGVEVIRNRVRR